MLSLFKNNKKKKKTSSKRSFDAAIRDRINNNWDVNPVSIDQDIRSSLKTLRNQARHLDSNSDYLRRYHTLLETGVIGHTGIMLQPSFKDSFGNINSKINDHLVEQFTAWARECDVKGVHDWLELQRLCLRGLARDGEAFFRIVKGSNHNQWQFALQMIDPSALDEQYNQDYDDTVGYSIKLSIKMDQWGKPISYFIKTDLPTGSHGVTTTEKGNKYFEIPANEMIHVFKPTVADQTRGIPFCVTAMKRLRILDLYEEAELVKARCASNKLGFFKRKNFEESNFGADEQDENGDYITEGSPGSFYVLPPDVEYQGVDWQHDSSYVEFVKQTLRGISSGLSIGYNELNNDLESVNFSSLRTAKTNTEDTYQEIQGLLIRKFISRVFSEWLETSANLTDLIKIPLREIHKYKYPTFVGRKWRYLDPIKDIKASILSVDNNLKSRHQIAAEQGLSVEQTLAELKKEQEMMEKLGIRVDSENNIDVDDEDLEEPEVKPSSKNKGKKRK